MPSILLFSDLTEANRDSILNILFPKNREDLTFAYMPSGGVHGAEDYVEQWSEIANEFGARFSAIDNTSTDPQESNKLLMADTVLISGGNTFQLLNNLKKSGLDRAIIEFSRKKNVILSGFSAGALVLTPTIAVCSLPGFDENLVGIDDFTGLGIIDFEVFPHYEKHLHQTQLEEYRKTTKFQVHKISDDEYILLDA